MITINEKLRGKKKKQLKVTLPVWQSENQKWNSTSASFAPFHCCLSRLGGELPRFRSELGALCQVHQETLQLGLASWDSRRAGNSGSFLPFFLGYFQSYQHPELWESPSHPGWKVQSPNHQHACVLTSNSGLATRSMKWHHLRYTFC